jgi:hypothetical protein
MASSTSKITLFNPDDTPAVYDMAGHTVGGAERVEVEELDAAGQRAVDSGVLVREEPEGKAESKPEPKTASADAPPLPEPVEAADKSEKGSGGSGASTRARRG